MGRPQGRQVKQRFRQLKNKIDLNLIKPSIPIFHHSSIPNSQYATEIVTAKI